MNIMCQKKPLMTAHQLNRTLKRMFKVSEVGMGITETVDRNGLVEFYWQINENQSFYITVEASLNLVEDVNFDTVFVNVKRLVQTQFSTLGVREDSGMDSLRIEDFIENLRDALDKTNTVKYKPFGGFTTIYRIAE